MAKGQLRILAKCRTVAGAPQCTCTGCTYARGMHVLQALAESGQAFERSLPGGGCQRSPLVQSFGQTHRFLDAIDNRKLAVAKFADNHMEAVGAEVDCSDYLGIGVTFSVVSGRICRAGTYQTSPCRFLLRDRLAYGAKEEPHPQVVVALGLRITNCAPCKSSL